MGKIKMALERLMSQLITMNFGVREIPINDAENKSATQV
jgi:hypothetical protein